MNRRTHLVLEFAIIVGLASTSCAETSPESRGAPPELQTVDEFMGWDEAGDQAQRLASVDLQGRIEGMLVECMAERGLDYAPYEGPTGDRPVFGEGLSDSEFRLKYGYGVFTAMLDEARWNTEQEAEWKNYEGLEPDEWYWAFADEPDYMAALDACTVQVEEELGRPDPGSIETLSASLDEAWGSLHADLEEIPRRIREDSRYVEAENTWSACLAEEGYDFATKEHIDAYLMAKREEYEQNANLGTLVLTAAFEKDLQPFVDEELAIAVADLACRTEIDDISEMLRREYEGWFIDDNRDQLEEIRELEQQRIDMILEGWQT